MGKSDFLYQILGVNPSANIPSLNRSQIFDFQKRTGLILPEDLKECFAILGNVKSQYNEDLYRFFSLKQFKGINEELKYFGGSPDYRNIVNTLREYKECFVFADYMFHMFSYAIRLHNRESEKNDIYIICGDKYRIIADSFTAFIELYSVDSIKLQFED